MTRRSSPAGRQADQPPAEGPEAADRAPSQYVPGGDLPLHPAAPADGCAMTSDPPGGRSDGEAASDADEHEDDDGESDQYVPL